MNLLYSLLFVTTASVISAAPAPSAAVKAMGKVVALLQKVFTRRRGDPGRIVFRNWAEACQKDLDLGGSLRLIGGLIKPADCSNFVSVYQQFSDVLSQTTPGYVEIANSSPMQQRRSSVQNTVKIITSKMSLNPLRPQFDPPGQIAIGGVSFIDNLRKKCASDILDINIYTSAVTADLESLTITYGT